MRGHARWASSALSASLLALAFVSPAAANAATLESGLWWFDRGKVQAAHDAGFDGTGVTVAVIDGQINPDVIGLSGADLEVKDSYCRDAAGEPVPATSTDYVAASHGTHVVSMIAGTGGAPAGGLPVTGAAPGAKILYYPAIVTDGVFATSLGEEFDEECLLEDGHEIMPDGTSGMSRAIEDAVEDGADIISISLEGMDVTQALAKAEAAGVIVVAGLPNHSGVASQPAAGNGVVAVQSFGADGKIQSSTAIEGVGEPSPNQSDDVIVAAPGMGVLGQGSEDSWDEQVLLTGTSYATPIVAGFLAVVKQKYPDATSGQLLQSLIRNTGTKGEHEPEWNDSGGYGAVSLTGMLAVDPTVYPDVNPIFDADDPNARPSAADVRAAAAAATPAPTPDTDEPREPSSGHNALTPLLVGGGILIAVLIAGGISLAVVLTRSSRRRNDEQGGAHGR
ncbi:hypothetical protein CW368_12200 [Actinomycetales bacterium SN12]|nr:hypothetical protein CW368_12200 [Actinomycetales bacterium SN12]